METRFTSLAEMQEAHSLLLQQQRQYSDIDAAPPEFVADVERFLQRGQAAGAVLDSARERESAQIMLDYWVTRLYRIDREPPEPDLAEFDPELAPTLPDEPSPYVGLAAFTSDRFFHGRDAVVGELLDLLRHGDRLVIVSGPSGSGKSSVVLGGLIPRLQKDAIAGSAAWRYVQLVPGVDPVASLEHALQAAPGAGARFIFVDQFEEIFTLCQDRAQREAFVAALLRHVDGGDVVVLTIRSDFVEYIPQLPDLQARLDHAQVDLRPFSIRELRDAIVRPAAEVGLKFDEGIVDDLVAKTLGVRGGLPLLQFTLLRLWQNRERNRITRAVYQRVGSPLEALRRSADAFYTALPDEEKITAQRTLLKLLKPTDEGTEVTRNRIDAAEIYIGNDSRERVDAVLNKLIAAGLVRYTGDGRQVEVAHEALLRNWPKLEEWLTTERERLRDVFILRDRAKSWEASGRDPASLLRGRELERAEAYDASDLDAAARSFIAESRKEADAAERAEEERQKRELAAARVLADEQSRRAQLEAASARQSRRMATGLGVLAVVAALMAVLALVQSIQANSARATADTLRAAAEASSAKAQQERDVAESRRLSAEALNEASIDLTQSLSKTIEANAITQTVQSQDALRQLVLGLRQYTLSGHSAPVRAAAFSPDGARLVTASDDSTAVLWDVATGAQITTFVGHASPVVVAQFSPDGARVATASDDGTARVWDVAGQSPPVIFARHDSPVKSVQFSPANGDILTVGDDFIARVWDGASGNERLVLGGDDFGVISAQYSPRGDRILTVGNDRLVRIWDAATGVKAADCGRRQAGISDAQFSPDGTQIAARSFDNVVVIWDFSGQSCVAHTTITAPEGFQVLSARFSPDGQTVVTVGVDQVTRLWSAEDGQAITSTLPLTDLNVRDAFFSPDGKSLLVLSTSKKANLFASDQWRQSTVLGGHDKNITTGAFSPDGRLVVTAGEDQIVHLHLVRFEDVVDVAKDEIAKRALPVGDP